MSSSTYTRTHFDAFLETLPYSPNDFQMKALERVAFEDGNTQISAVAGSGKTSLIEMIIRLRRDIERVTGMNPVSIIYLVFNVANRDEAMRKFKGLDVTVVNMNKLGNDAIHAWLKNRGEKPRGRNRSRIQDVDDKKYPDLAKEHLNEILGFKYETVEVDPVSGDPVMRSTWSLSYTCAGLAEKALLSFVTADNTDAIRWLAEHHNTDWKQAQQDTIDQCIEEVIPAMLRSGEQMWRNRRVISLTEQITLPIIENMPLEQYDWVLGDEAQDWNIGQQVLAVRSLKEDGNAMIVGDPYQAIMGFGGADDKSWWRMQRVFDAKLLDLNITYRCPRKVVDIARAAVPHIEARPDAPEGEVITGITLFIPDSVTSRVKPSVAQGSLFDELDRKHAKDIAPADMHESDPEAESVRPIDTNHLYSYLRPNTLIMGRLNATVVAAFFELVRIKAESGDDHIIQVIGRDISNSILTMTKTLAKMQGFSWSSIDLYLAKYEDQQRAKIRRFRSPSLQEEKVEELEDDIDTIKMCLRHFDVSSLKAFEAKVKEVFGISQQDDDKRIAIREQAVSLCTAHKAKGLEAHTAVILSPDEFMSDREGQRLWQKQQEQNLAYVAVTRAMQRLIVVKNPESDVGELPLKATAYDPEKAARSLEEGRKAAIAAMDQNAIPGVNVDGLLGLTDEVPTLPAGDDEPDAVEANIIEDDGPAEHNLADLTPPDAPDSKPDPIAFEDNLPDPAPTPTVAKLAVDTALGTLDDTGADLRDKLMAFDVDTIDTLITVLTHIKSLKAAPVTTEVEETKASA